MRRILYLSLIFILPCFSQAQKTWTVDECMQYAVEHSTRCGQSSARIKSVSADYLRAIGQLLPTLSAGSNVNFNFGRGLDAETNTYTDINSFYNSYSIDARMTLFDGFGSVFTLRMARYNKLLGREELRVTQDKVALETMEAFFQLIYYQGLVSFAEERMQESENNLKQVRRMWDLGLKGSPDVAEMEAKAAEDNLNLTKQKNLCLLGLIVLKEKMNFPIDEELVIKDVGKVIDATYEIRTTNDIYQLALGINPEVDVARYKFKMEEQSYKVALAGLSPRITAGAGWSTGFNRFMNGSPYDSFREQLKNKRGHYVGFGLSIPLFSGFSKTAAIKREKAQMIGAKFALQEAERKLYRDVEQAVADVNGQIDEYRLATRQYDARRAAYEVSKRKYQEGLISALEMHTSRNLLEKAEIEQLNASFKYRLKKRLLDYYAGEPLVKIEINH